MTTSISRLDDDQLGGPHSVLVRQKRDHVELDRLITEVDLAQGAQRQKVLNALCRLVFPHAFAEESVLWPAIRAMLPDGEQQTLQIELEHQQINELFTDLEQTDPDSAEHHRLWAEITRLLREDVRDEEDSLFPELRAVASDRQLQRLGWSWLAVRRTAPTRPHPVVARRPPGNALAALPLTVIDRTRDRLDRIALTTDTGLATTVSQGLAAVAGRIELLGVLRTGERSATHIDPDDRHP